MNSNSKFQKNSDAQIKCRCNCSKGVRGCVGLELLVDTVDTLARLVVSYDAKLNNFVNTIQPMHDYYVTSQTL